jgi:hypothetical protein
MSHIGGDRFRAAWHELRDAMNEPDAENVKEIRLYKVDATSPVIVEVALARPLQTGIGEATHVAEVIEAKAI